MVGDSKLMIPPFLLRRLLHRLQPGFPRSSEDHRDVCPSQPRPLGIVILNTCPKKRRASVRSPLQRTGPVGDQCQRRIFSRLGTDSEQ